MSHEATSWAYLQDPGHYLTKFVLVTLANAADKHGICFPSRRALARDCGVKMETVSTQLSKLVEQGLIYRLERQRENGSRTSDWIVLAPNQPRAPMTDCEPDAHLPALRKLALGHSPSEGECPSPSRRGGGLPPRGGGLNHQEEPGVSKETPHVQMDLSGKPAEDVDDRVAQDILRVFNEVFGKRLTGKSWWHPIRARVREFRGTVDNDGTPMDITVESQRALLTLYKQTDLGWVDNDLEPNNVYGTSKGYRTARKKAKAVRGGTSTTAEAPPLHDEWW